MQQVHQKRMALKLSQTELADLLGCDRASISRWELGIKPPRSSWSRRLIQWLEFDPEGGRV
jgi:DNA-binding transcriptional regulator YiaG